MARDCTLLRNARATITIVVVMGVVLGAVVGLLVGAFVGGNFAANFQFFHLRGYEATGVLGLLLGMLLGGALGSRWRRRDSRPLRERRG